MFNHAWIRRPCTFISRGICCIMPANALPYHEPSIIQILILASFILFLNIVNSLIDSYIYCGLIGQIFIGIAWGLPGAAWLSIPIQQAITQLGYLGLILMVFEGGLSTSLSALKSNLLLSVAVALTGILLPMTLSFSLMGFANATALQAFAAGAALCSTSLGTTFTLLSSSGLVTSRLGVVLSSAAMLDDVVGLVMVQIISNLGRSSTLSAVTIVRPVIVSLAFATVLPALCLLVFKPILHFSLCRRPFQVPNWAKLAVTSLSIAFVLQNFTLLAFVTAASYAGTSNLFSAYLAGVFISWAYAQLGSNTENMPRSSQNPSHERQDHDSAPPKPATEIYDNYLSPTVHRVLKPFFFVSHFLQHQAPVQPSDSSYAGIHRLLYPPNIHVHMVHYPPFPDLHTFNADRETCLRDLGLQNLLPFPLPICTSTVPKTQTQEPRRHDCH